MTTLWKPTRAAEEKSVCSELTRELKEANKRAAYYRAKLAKPILSRLLSLREELEQDSDCGDYEIEQIDDAIRHLNQAIYFAFAPLNMDGTPGGGAQVKTKALKEIK